MPTLRWRSAARTSVLCATTLVTNDDPMAKTRKISVSHTLIVNIMITAPVTLPTAVSRRSRPVCSTSLVLSRSLVTRLMMRPG